MRVVLNLVAFNLGWLASVLGGAAGVPWAGVMVVTGVVALHLFLARQPGEEIKIVGVALLLGVVWDSALVAAGWITYPSGMVVPGAAPFWIVAMWANFVTLLNVSLRWLRGRPALAALLGAAGGPLTYWGGAQLGGATLVAPAAVLGALAVGWAVFTPALVAFAQRHDGFTATEGPDLALGARS